MDKHELIERFNEIGGGGGMLKKAFSMLAEASPKCAYEFLECMEGCCEYKNFLTESEALTIVKAFKNDDGTTGAKWSPETMFDKIESLGFTDEICGCFNKWSLFVVMNMMHSDFGRVLRKWTEGDAEEYVKACYDLAVARLQDIDRPNFVREYFGLE